MSLINSVKTYMSVNRITQGNAAVLFGISEAALSQYLNGTYKADVSHLEEKIQDAIDLEMEKLSAPPIKVAYAKTKSAEYGLGIIRNTHRDRELCTLTGSPGTGKTMILKEYANRYRGVVLLEADSGYTSKVVVEELAEKLGVAAKGNIHNYTKEIIKKLSGTNKIILVDEAENLPYRSLEILRRIHDKANIALVLGGTEQLIKNMTGTFAERGNFQQLYSRVGCNYNLGDKLPQADIFLMIKSAIPELEDREAVLIALFNKSEGNARRLYKIMRSLAQSHYINGNPLNIETINNCASVLLG